MAVPVAYTYLADTDEVGFDFDDGSKMAFPASSPAVQEAVAGMQAQPPPMMPPAAPPQMGPDRRLAQNMSEDPGQLMSTAPGADTMSPMPPAQVADVGPTMSEDPALNYTPAPPMSIAPEAPPTPPASAPTGRRVNPFAGQPGAAPQGGGFDFQPIIGPARAGHAVRIPGGWKGSARDVVQGTPMPEGWQDRLADAQMKDRAALENDLFLSEQENAARLASMRRMEEQQAAHEAERRERERRKAGELNRLTAERAQLVDEVTNSAVNTDMNSLWEGKGVGGTMAAVFGGILAGGISASRGWENTVLARLNKEWDSNIEEQKRVINQKGAKIGEVDTVYARMLDRFGDEEMAAQASLQAGIAQTQRELERVLAGTQDARARNDLLRLEAALARQMLDEEKKWSEITSDKITRRDVYQQDRVVSVGGYDPLKELKRQSEAAGYLANIAEGQAKMRGSAGGVAQDDPLAVSTADGHVFKARDDQEAKEMRELEANYLDTKKKLGRAVEFLKDPSRHYGGKTGARAELLQAQIETGIAKSYGGPIQDSDRESARMESPNITTTDIRGLELAKAEEALRTLEDRMQSHRARKLVGYQNVEVKRE